MGWDEYRHLWSSCQSQKCIFMDQPLALVSPENQRLPSSLVRLEIIKLHSIQVTSYQWSIATSSSCFCGSKINYWVDCLLQLDGWLLHYSSTDLEINQEPKSKHAMQYKRVNTARERISLSAPVTAGLPASHLSGQLSKESWCGAALGLLYGHPIIISLFLTPSLFSIDMIGISFL